MTTRANAAYHFPPFHPKLQRHKRADRRVHKARLKKQAAHELKTKKWVPGYQPTKTEIGKYVATGGAGCSCGMCRPGPEKAARKIPPMPEIETHSEMQALIQEDEWSMELWPSTYQSKEDWDAENTYDPWDDDWRYYDWDSEKYDPDFDEFDYVMNRRYTEYAEDEYQSYMKDDDDSSKTDLLESWLKGEADSVFDTVQGVEFSKIYFTKDKVIKVIEPNEFYLP